MAFSVGGMYEVEVLKLIAGLRDGDGLTRPVNGGVGSLKPGQPEDDVFSATRHDVEEVFLCNTFYVDKEGASEANFLIFV